MDRRQAFAQAVSHGWVEHLLPVIPANATLAQDSVVAAKDRGKVPGRRFANGTYDALRDWQVMRATEIDVRRWQEFDCNIGLNCRVTRAVDIDSDNPEIVGAIRRVLTLRLGETPWRGRAGTPRGAALYRAERNIGGKVMLAWTEADGTAGKLELLGYGNQMVIWGNHLSGTFYEWHGGSPFEQAVDALPLLAEADIPDLLTAVTAALRSLRCTVGKPSARGLSIRRGGIRRKLGDAAMVAADFDQAGRALQAIPNKPGYEHVATYDQVIGFIAAFIGAVAGSREHIDKYLVPWLKEWPDNSDSWIESKIDSFKDGTELGADRLFACARTWGFLEVPVGEFEQVNLMEEPAKVISLAEIRQQAKDLLRGPDESVIPAATMMGNPYTDQQLARRFWEDVGINLVRLHASGHWLVWERNRWVTGNDAAEHLVRQYIGYLVRGLDESRRSDTLAFRLEGVDRASAILRVLRKIAVVERWDQDKELLNTPRGIVNLRTGEWRRAVPTDYVRSITPAEPSNAVPELWLKALDDIFEGDRHKVQVWIDWLALSLLGFRVRDIALYLDGSGRNGKSMLLDTAAHMLGDVTRGGYAYKTALPDAFDEQRSARTPHAESLAMMDGARMVMFSETPVDFKPKEALLKAAIAGELVEASQKYKNTFQYRFTGSLTFATNVPVTFTSAIPALRQRFHTLYLMRRFEDDREFYDRVVSEAPQVLGLCIRRCVAIMQGAETFWIKESWQQNRLAFEEMHRGAEERFELADPITGTLRALIERKATGQILSADLLERVRMGLKRIRDAFDEECEPLDQALSMTDRALGMRIAQAVRREFGKRSSTVGNAGYRGFKGINWKPSPRLPFVN